MMTIDRACQRYDCNPADLLIADIDCQQSRLAVIIHTMLIAEAEEYRVWKQEEKEAEQKKASEEFENQLRANMGGGTIGR